MTTQPNHSDDELDKIFEDWEYEVTGTPKHWGKSDERKAIDVKYRAAIQAYVQQEVVKGRADFAQQVIDRGHNIDCIFCGFKDKLCIENGATLKAEGADHE